MVARGGRSKEGGDGGASGRAELVSSRREEEKEGDDRRVPQKDKISGCYVNKTSRAACAWLAFLFLGGALLLPC